MSQPVHLDGTLGEGGGQVLRTALSLSLVTRTPIHIVRIRARRSKPGLRPQHLAAVEAAARVGQARVHGAVLGSAELLFEPQQVVPGTYEFRIGTAGSATLVLETVLPALMVASTPSHVTIEGGTHNPLAPPFEFVERALCPILARMGQSLEVELERYGFYPAGGGRMTLAIAPCPLRTLELVSRGKVQQRRARAIVARLPRTIAERELEVVSERLGLPETALELVEATSSAGPGNALLVEIASEHVTEVFAGIGQRGVRAESVAERVAREARTYVDAGVPVGRFLADQLLVPLALAGSGVFHTLEPSSHTRTNAEVIEKLLPVRFSMDQLSDHVWRIEVAAAPGGPPSASRDCR